jgi:hypothetical protein
VAVDRENIQIPNNMRLHDAEEDSEPALRADPQNLDALAIAVILRYDAARWAWDLERIQTKAYTDNIVDLLASKLTRLPAKRRSFCSSWPVSAILPRSGRSHCTRSAGETCSLGSMGSCPPGVDHAL